MAAAPDDRWVVVSGAGGVLGRALASHFAARGSQVLALDRKIDAVASLPGVSARSVDLLIGADVRQALADAIPTSESIALLINAVGLIWNEPILALRGAKFAIHDLESWRGVIDANLTAPFIAATQVDALALGFIDVPTTRNAVSDERLRAYVQKTSMGRLGRVEDVINAIEFLAANTFTNGTIMKLDGGLRL